MLFRSTVIALNAISQSQPSLPSPAVVPMGPPTAPTNVVVTRGDKQIVVSWTASNPNGSPITAYQAVASPSAPGAGTCSPVPVTATTCTITGLTNGTSYTVIVSATNAAGTTLSNLTGTGTWQDLTIISPFTTTVVNGYNTQAFYLLVNTGGNVAQTVDIRIYGDTVQG